MLKCVVGIQFFIFITNFVFFIWLYGHHILYYIFIPIQLNYHRMRVEKTVKTRFEITEKEFIFIAIYIYTL